MIASTPIARSAFSIYVLAVSHKHSMQPDPTLLSAEIAKSPTLQRAASQLGIKPSRLQPRPRSAFQFREEERDAIIDLRLELHERSRVEIAKEIHAQHRQVLARERASSAALVRSASVNALATTPAAGSGFSLTHQQQRAKDKSDMRRLNMLAKRREAPSDEWYDRKHQQAERELDKAQRRHDRYIAHQMASRQGLADNQGRARDRVEEARQEELKSEQQTRRDLAARMQRASKFRENQDKLERREIEKQHVQERKRDLKRAKSLDRMSRDEERRVRTLNKKFEREEQTRQQMISQRYLDSELREERRRLLQEDHEARRRRLDSLRAWQASEVTKKHEASDQRQAKLQASNEAALGLRRAASVRGSLQRKAIIVNSLPETAWVERLRWTPLPEDP